MGIDHIGNSSLVQIQWRHNCQVLGLGLVLVIGLVFCGYESLCTTSIMIVTLSIFFSDELAVWRVDCICVRDRGLGYWVFVEICRWNF